MDSFNNEYKNKDRVISIKKYLSKNEVDGQKIGGTIQHIYDEYTPKIPNFKNLLEYEINKYDNIIFIELLHLFFVKENKTYFGWFLVQIINKMLKYLTRSFLNNLKDKSFEKIHTSLIGYINLHLYFINYNDLEISIQFLHNLSDFILKELCPKKLIYFIPEIIFLRFRNMVLFIFFASYVLYCIKKKEESNPSNTEKVELISKVIELNKECHQQFLSILLKITSDKNIQFLNLKFQSVYCLEINIEIIEFNNEDLISIFNV